MIQSVGIMKVGMLMTKNVIKDWYIKSATTSFDIGLSTGMVIAIISNHIVAADISTRWVGFTIAAVGATIVYIIGRVVNSVVSMSSIEFMDDE